MHVCGSHEQAIAKFGLRADPAARRSTSSWAPAARCASPTCPRWTKPSRSPSAACVVTTYGDMVRVPGTRLSLADAQADRRARSRSSTRSRRPSTWRARRATRWCSSRPGFETTAVATAAVALGDLPAELLDPLGAQVRAAGHGDRRGAAGHEDRGVPRGRPRRRRHGLEAVRADGAQARRADRGGRLRTARHPRCAAPARRTGSRPPAGGRQHVPAVRVAGQATSTRRRSCGRSSGSRAGHWRGIAWVPDGNLELRDEFAHVDARKRFGLGRARGPRRTPRRPPRASAATS